MRNSFDPSYLEVTPAALKELQDSARSVNAKRWWLSVEMTPHGCCTGLKHKLWIQTDEPTAEEFLYPANGVTCVLLKRQRHLAQGMRIDFGTMGGQRGFIVTSPKATPETKAALAKWVKEELGEQYSPLIAADAASPPQQK